MIAKISGAGSFAGHHAGAYRCAGGTSGPEEFAFKWFYNAPQNFGTTAARRLFGRGNIKVKALPGVMGEKFLPDAQAALRYRA